MMQPSFVPSLLFIARRCFVGAAGDRVVVASALHPMFSKMTEQEQGIRAGSSSRIKIEGQLLSFTLNRRLGI
jgi:hypothetical protein